MVQFMQDSLRAQQFDFNPETVAYEHEDGIVVDFSPCSPLAR